MFERFKKYREKKKKFKFAKVTLRPILFPLVILIDTTLKGWKILLIKEMQVADPSKIIELVSDSIDALRTNIKEQITEVLKD